MARFKGFCFHLASSEFRWRTYMTIFTWVFFFEWDWTSEAPTLPNQTNESSIDAPWWVDPGKTQEKYSKSFLPTQVLKKPFSNLKKPLKIAKAEIFLRIFLEFSRGLLIKRRRLSNGWSSVVWELQKKVQSY